LHNFFLGIDPLKAPAFYSMIAAIELVEGSFFPIGGMYSIIDKLVSHAKGLGVKFQYNSPVEKIMIDNNTARGILLKTGDKINADIIVANADLPYVYRELLPDKSASVRFDHMKYTCSAMVFHWGLKKQYPCLGHHSVFIPDKYDINLKKIFKEKNLSENPVFYVHAPVRTDPSAAPHGQDSITIIVPVGHIDEKEIQDWNKMQGNARIAVFKRFSEIGIKNLKNEIKFEICYFPNTWQTALNLSRGATFGSLNHNIFQVGYFRPKNRHKKYKNLFFVGGSTHPGSGIPLVLMSAKLTTERILKEMCN
jgi:phytoene desaturase